MSVMVTCRGVFSLVWTTTPRVELLSTFYHSFKPLVSWQRSKPQHSARPLHSEHVWSVTEDWINSPCYSLSVSQILYKYSIWGWQYLTVSPVMAEHACRTSTGVLNAYLRPLRMYGLWVHQRPVLALALMEIWIGNVIVCILTTGVDSLKFTVLGKA